MKQLRRTELVCLLECHSHSDGLVDFLSHLVCCVWGPPAFKILTQSHCVAMTCRLYYIGPWRTDATRNTTTRVSWMTTKMTTKRDIRILIGKCKITGKSFSEALILASTNTQSDKKLFIELRVQYIKIASSEHEVDHFVLNVKTKTKNNLCTKHVLPMSSPRFELAIFMYILNS